jgi:hypothetical protein
MTRKQYRNIFLQTNLEFISSIDVLYVDVTSKSAPKFSINYLQFMDWATVIMWHLHFYYWPINIKHNMMMCSDIRYQRLQKFVWMFVQQLFMLTSKPPFTTHWQECGQAVKFMTELVAENSLWDSASCGSQHCDQLISVGRPRSSMPCMDTETVGNMYSFTAG